MSSASSQHENKLLTGEPFPPTEKQCSSRTSIGKAVTDAVKTTAQELLVMLLELLALVLLPCLFLLTSPKCLTRYLIAMWPHKKKGKIDNSKFPDELDLWSNNYSCEWDYLRLDDWLDSSQTIKDYYEKLKMTKREISYRHKLSEFPEPVTGTK